MKTKRTHLEDGTVVEEEIKTEQPQDYAVRGEPINTWPTKGWVLIDLKANFIGKPTWRQVLRVVWGFDIWISWFPFFKAWALLHVILWLVLYT